MTREQFDKLVPRAMKTFEAFERKHVATRSSSVTGADITSDAAMRIYADELYAVVSPYILAEEFVRWLLGVWMTSRKRLLSGETLRKEVPSGLKPHEEGSEFKRDEVEELDDDTSGSPRERPALWSEPKPRELMRDVRRALAQFEEPLRSDLYDYWTGAATIEQIAAERGEKYWTVQKRIRRASDKLRELLADYAGVSAGHLVECPKTA